jgi:L-alanine-DL-glutamate epimerase-like enolase superfamily enzyme
MDPSHIEHIWQTLWRSQFFRGGHVHAAAVAAIDIALWDLRQGARRPVYDLLGGRTRDYARVLLACGPARRSRRRAGIDAMVSDAREQVAPGRQIRRGRGQTRGPRWGV